MHGYVLMLERKRYAVTRLKDATVREKYSDAGFDIVSAQWESEHDME